MSDTLEFLTKLVHDRGTSFVCTSCGAADTKVKDSRPAPWGQADAIRRRRVCGQCKARFTTYELTQAALEQLLAAHPQAIIGGINDVEQAVQRLAKLLGRRA